MKIAFTIFVQGSPAFSIAFKMGSSKAKAEQNYTRHPFLMPVQDVIGFHNTNSDIGLTVFKTTEAQMTHGSNKLEGEDAIQWYSIFFKANQ